MIKVFLVDDHEIVRRGIAQLIAAEPDLMVVGESATVHRTMGRIEASRPDVVVLDVNLPDGTGIELCRDIRSGHPEIRCLILTGHADDAVQAAAARAGASGHVLKSVRGGRLIEGIHRAARGEVSVPQGTADRARRRRSSQTVENRPSGRTLTLRERQVLGLITDGLTNRQIGVRLGLAEKTVKNYVSALLTKLGMQRRIQVAAYGASLGPRDLHS